MNRTSPMIVLHNELTCDWTCHTHYVLRCKVHRGQTLRHAKALPWACTSTAPVNVCCHTSAGPMVHHVTLNAKEPGLPPHTHVHGAPVEGSLRCELEVLQVTRLAAQDLPAALQPYFHEQAWEAELALRTGRTHQARPSSAHPLILDAGHCPPCCNCVCSRSP